MWKPKLAEINSFWIKCTNICQLGIFTKLYNNINLLYRHPFFQLMPSIFYADYQYVKILLYSWKNIVCYFGSYRCYMIRHLYTANIEVYLREPLPVHEKAAKQTSSLASEDLSTPSAKGVWMPKGIRLFSWYVRGPQSGPQIW